MFAPGRTSTSPSVVGVPVVAADHAPVPGDRGPRAVCGRSARGRRRGPRNDRPRHPTRRLCEATPASPPASPRAAPHRRRGTRSRRRRAASIPSRSAGTIPGRVDCDRHDVRSGSRRGPVLRRNSRDSSSSARCTTTTSSGRGCCRANPLQALLEPRRPAGRSGTSTDTRGGVSVPMRAVVVTARLPQQPGESADPEPLRKARQLQSRRRTRAAPAEDRDGQRQVTQRIRCQRRPALRPAAPAPLAAASAARTPWRARTARWLASAIPASVATVIHAEATIPPDSTSSQVGRHVRGQGDSQDPPGGPRAALRPGSPARVSRPGTRRGSETRSTRNTGTASPYAVPNTSFDDGLGQRHAAGSDAAARPRTGRPRPSARRSRGTPYPPRVREAGHRAQARNRSRSRAGTAARRRGGRRRRSGRSRSPPVGTRMMIASA